LWLLVLQVTPLIAAFFVASCTPHRLGLRRRQLEPHGARGLGPHGGSGGAGAGDAPEAVSAINVHGLHFIHGRGRGNTPPRLGSISAGCQSRLILHRVDSGV